jgi:hypothetical protein
VIRGAAGSCCFNHSILSTTTRWSGGGGSCAKIEGFPYLSVIHSRAASVACPRPWSFQAFSKYNRLTAHVTVFLAAETNERALRVFISRKSRYFVLIDPIKAELGGRRELTAACTTTDEGKRKQKLNLIASNRPFCTEKRFATFENNGGSDYLPLTR